MISICRYTQNKQTEWDAFVKVSKNGTFLFLRAYMDYHSDRFTDHSLMYYNEKGKLIAVLPANGPSKSPLKGDLTRGEGVSATNSDLTRGEGDPVLAPSFLKGDLTRGEADRALASSPFKGDKRGSLYTHQGLTYGGFILSPRVHSTEIGEMFDITIKYLRENGFSEWYYKQMPSIYHQLPSEDDEYWLWRNGAQLNVCNLATTVPLNDIRTKLIDKCRMRRQRQAAQHGFHIDNNGSLDTIWAIIQESLMAHHKASPIHTLDEMKLLCSRLPEYIQTLTVKDCDGNDLAGAVLYCSDQVVHVQYAHATLKGYDLHVMDYLYFALIDKFQKEGKYKYFDFGTSNEDAGRFLNENLVAQKEGFGGRGIAYKIWKIEV
ncbi:MAG: GNAT family N-acetyltransferase [Prevotellaceae bacterium]|nr:GNAT family N-acetyltransferase [Prevotellaceae bacterium]